MTRTMLAFIALALSAGRSATLRAQVEATEQSESGVGIAAGGSKPTGDFSKIANRGYHATIFAMVRPRYSLFEFRGEASFSQFSYRSSTPSASARILSVTANALSTDDFGRGVYLIAGVGMYQASSVCSACSSKSTRGGINAGSGFRFPLGSHKGFLELRYHYIPGGMDPTTGGVKSGTRFIPLSFGFKF